MMGSLSLMSKKSSLVFRENKAGASIGLGRSWNTPTLVLYVMGQLLVLTKLENYQVEAYSQALY